MTEKKKGFFLGALFVIAAKFVLNHKEDIATYVGNVVTTAKEWWDAKFGKPGEGETPNSEGEEPKED